MMVLISPKQIDTAKDLEKAFLKWGDSIYGYIFLRVKTRETAEDLSQEVFFKAFRSRETFDQQKSSLKTWIFTIAKNTLTDHFKNSNEQTHQDIDELADKLEDKKTDIETQTHNKNLTTLVLDKLKLLTPRDQELIILRFKNDLPVKEISKILDLEYSATKVAIHRALQKLTDLCKF